MSNPKQSDPSLDKGIAKKVRDEIGDSFPNDILEVGIIITVLIATSGAAYTLYLMYELSQVSG